jgi:hypothetical protein
MLVLLVLVTVAVLALAYDRTQIIDWVGGYPVRVRIERSGPRPVSGAAAAALFRCEWDAIEGDPARIGADWQTVAVSGADPFTVQVKCGGKDTGLGRTVSYVRQEVLVLKVDYADGGSELVVADLPDKRSNRELLVRVP